MKKLLVMGGTRITCEIVRKAKQMGIFVGVADYNPPEKSPAKTIADEHFQVSCTDVDAMSALIKTQKYDGVLVGFNDMLLPYYADICEKTGLPAYGTKEQFDIFINKDKYKKLLREYGVPTVQEYHIDLNNVAYSAETVKFPVLVKPADSSGSRGISICRNVKELEEAVSKAADYSKTGKILVEQYLTGKEATVFWIFCDGEYHFCGIGNRHVKHNQEGAIPLPVGYTYPAKATVRYQNEVVDKAKEMFRSVGIKNGMMFMQCKIEDGVCVAYDIGYRLTGTLEYKNFMDACGYDPLEMLIHFALTGRMCEKEIHVDPMFNGAYPFNVSLLAKPGKIADIVGIGEARTIPGVIDAVVAHYPGEEITEAMKGLLAQITVRILGTAQRKEDVIPTMKRIEQTIKIVSDQGENLRLPGIEDEDINDVI